MTHPNPGRYPLRSTAGANRLNAVALDESSDRDNNEADGFEGSQYDPEDDPAYEGAEEVGDDFGEDEPSRLGTVRFQDEMDRWHCHALHTEDSDEKVADALELGARDAYEGPSTFRPNGPAQRTTSTTKPSRVVKPTTTPIPSESRVRYKVAESQDRPIRDRRCLIAEIEVDGVPALTLFDSGSQVDAISPDFARALQLDFFKLDRTMALQLGTKGSHATFSYEVQPTLSYERASFGTKKIDVINIDRYELLLGAPFFNHYGAVLDFQNRVVHIGGVTVPALSTVEETALLAKRKAPSKGST